MLTANTVIEMQLQLPLTFFFSLDSVSIVNITYFDTFNPCLKQNKQNPSVNPDLCLGLHLCCH